MSAPRKRGRPALPVWPAIPARYHEPHKLQGTERRIYEGLVKAHRLKAEREGMNDALKTIFDQ